MKFKSVFLPTLALSVAATFAPVNGPLVGVNSAEAKLFCSNDGARFNEWKQVFVNEYSRRYKQSTLNKFANVNYNTKVISSDRKNRASFKGTFNDFYKRRATGVSRIAKKKWAQYKSHFDRAEREFGVPAEIILSIWGLETAFGRYSGNVPILESTATLAYDCRRSESLFFKQLIAAMDIIDRGIYDLSTARGAFHGELGQTQFLPASFLLGATDYDGGGVDVFRSPPDVIGSTAKWLSRNGWRKGGSYAEGSRNFNVIKKWNAATNYQKTIVKLAGEIKGSS